MKEITAAHEAIDRRTRRAQRTILKMAERSGLRMDVQALLRATVMDETAALAELAHTMVDTVAGDDVIVNELYIEAIEPREDCRQRGHCT